MVDALRRWVVYIQCERGQINELPIKFEHVYVFAWHKSHLYSQYGHSHRPERNVQFCFGITFIIIII